MLCKLLKNTENNMSKKNLSLSTQQKVAKVKLGYSVFKYNHAKGNQPFYKSKGNTLDDLGNYLNDFIILPKLLF